MNFLKQFLNWVFPNNCIICHKEVPENSIFCPCCFSKITFIDHPICKICGKMQTISNYEDSICETCINYPKLFDISRSLFQYDKESKKIIMKIKMLADNNIAKICSNMIVSRYGSLLKNIDLVVPVPSHWTRILKRGYNPSNIISFELSKILNIIYNPILKRKKKTAYQKNKNIQERIDNVENAFSCSKSTLKGKSIILVDDVFTTGATLNECSKTLKNYGAKYVFCITIAATPILKSSLLIK